MAGGTRRAGAALAMLALVAAACSSGPKAAAVTVAATAEGEGEAQKFGFDIDEAVTGGRVDLTLDNSSGAAEHEVQLLELSDGKTQQDALPVLEAAGDGGPIPEWIGLRGGVGATEDGGSATVSLNIPAGTYLFLCFIDDHMQRGMIETVNVGEGEEADLPETDAAVSMIDYGFEIEGLEAGEQGVTFTNGGNQPHFTAIMTFDGDPTVAEVEADVQRLLKNEEPTLGEPTEVGGSAALDPGESLVAELSLEAGVYVFICFLSDRAGGPPHVAKGMVEVLEVA